MLGTESEQGQESKKATLAVFPSPKLDVYSCVDPRQPDRRIGIVAFYYPDRPESWDIACQAGFLGNFWPQPAGENIVLTPPGFPDTRHTFKNAEAAFQALKFWKHANKFENCSGGEAFQLKKRLGTPDWSYGGFGSNWAGMLGVLHEKYKPGSECSKALLETGDAFLLEHNSVAERDKIWSDNCDGEGTNWLGLQLMLIRDELGGAAEVEGRLGTWTEFIREMVDISCGSLRSQGSSNGWQRAVKEAALIVRRG